MFEGFYRENFSHFGANPNQVLNLKDSVWLWYIVFVHSVSIPVKFDP